MKTSLKSRLALDLLEKELQTLNYGQSSTIFRGSGASSNGSWGWVGEEYFIPLKEGHSMK